MNDDLDTANGDIADGRYQNEEAQTGRILPGGAAIEMTEYEVVWGGSYMDEAGCWVVLLTENTAENQEKVFQLNPTLTEGNTILKKPLIPEVTLWI